jgi:pilus assembly protein CpaB
VDAAERLTRRLGLVALAAAVLAGLLARAALAHLAAARAPRTVPVVVAARDIPARTVLTPAWLAVARVVPALVPPEAVASPAAVRGLVTTAPLYAGQVLVWPDVARGAVPYGLSYAIPAGERAFTVPVGPTTGVAGLIRPGDRVDVLAVFGQGTDGLPHTTVVAVAQDVLVLAVDQDVVGGPGPAPSGYSTVTLEVAPRQAEVLAYAVARGQVVLTLRGATDQAPAALGPVTGQAVWGSGG